MPYMLNANLGFQFRSIIITRTIGSDLQSTDIPFPAAREVVLGKGLLKAPCVGSSAKNMGIWDYVLHIEHVSCVITNCGQHQRVTPSPLSITILFFAGGKHYQKIAIHIFRLVLYHFAIPGCFPYILFCRYLFSLLSSGWFVIAVCDSISVGELVKCLESL